MDEVKEPVKEENSGALLDTKLNELKSQNDRMEKNIKDLKELEARRILGGQANAGAQPVAPVEESAKEYAKRISTGKI